MIKRFSALSALFFLMAFKTVGQDLRPADIVRKSAQLLQSTQLWQYQSQYRIKYFDQKDTTVFPSFTCTVAKAPKDTILTYYAHIRAHQTDRVYDGRYFYTIEHAQKSILRYDPHLSGPKFVSANIQKFNIPSAFYTAKPFHSYLTEATASSMETTLVGGRICWKITFEMPVDEEITMLKRIIFIDQKTYLPVRFQGLAQYMHIQDEYWELNVQYLRTEQQPVTDFAKHYPHPQGYTEELFVLPTRAEQPLLAYGTSFIPFEATSPDGQTRLFDHSDTSKIIIVDFWYMACAPCIKAMPLLEALAKEYAQDLHVIGLNPVDDFGQKAKEMHQFRQRLGITYPFWSVKSTTAADYWVNTYPTLYIFHKGKIIHAQRGFGEQDAAQIRSILQAHIAK